MNQSNLSLSFRDPRLAFYWSLEVNVETRLAIELVHKLSGRRTTRIVVNGEVVKKIVGEDSFPC